MSVKSEVKKLWKILTDPQYRADRAPYRAFRKDHPKGTPAVFDHLKPGDVVLDVGGFEGAWAQTMTERYGVVAHVFEPHPKYAALLKDRFAGRDDVHVHSFAIGSGDGTLELSDEANASSAFAVQGATLKGQVRALSDVVQELDLSRVAVVKMNIEGGEYDLLPAMIQSGFITQVDRLTVQFHRYTEEQPAQCAEIRTLLARSHVCEWDYPFVWEQWARK